MIENKHQQQQNLHLQKGSALPESQRSKKLDDAEGKLDVWPQRNDCPDICIGGFVAEELHNGSSTLFQSKLKCMQNFDKKQVRGIAVNPHVLHIGHWSSALLPT